MRFEKKVAVTGATGFIGGRLVERLFLEHGASVRTLVRDFARASRVARFPVEMVHGAIGDRAAVAALIRDCSVVFHCAHDFADPEQNLAAVKIMAESCLAEGVERLVYVSSISVYEPLSDGDLDETTEAKATASEYAANKLAAEQLLLQYHREAGLPVAIIQPTVVYGPFSSPWTLAPVQRLRKGRVIIPVDDGPGLCSAVYVDDVVQGLMLAARRDAAVGECFLISGASPVTWIEFYEAYRRVLGAGSVETMSSTEILRLRSASESGNGYRAPVRERFRLDPRETLSQWIPGFLRRSVRALLGMRKWEKLKEAFPSRAVLPSDQLLGLYRARTRVKIDKARRMLGYEPAFDFEQGMAMTADFIRWAEL